MEKGLTRNQMIQELSRSPHGKLGEFTKIGFAAAIQDPEFYAHLISWNQINGEVRDSKVALPVISLACPDFALAGDALVENSFAHLALLDPRTLLRAIKFSRDIEITGHGKRLRRLVASYLRAREAVYPWWERTAVQHRESLKTLYTVFHIKPAAFADLNVIKNKPVKGTVFEDIANLKHMSVKEAAGTILNRKIPFLVAIGALGDKSKDPDLVMAMLEMMTPAEVVTNIKMLERLGVRWRGPRPRRGLRPSRRRTGDLRVP
jgi:hypothetical protein